MKNGGSVTPDLFWTLIDALDKDLGAADDAGKARHDETIKLLAAHVREDEKRADAQAGKCSDLHRALLKEQFASEHESTAADAVTARAELVAETAKAAATEAARLVVKTAKDAAAVRVVAAEDAAGVLVDAAEKAPKRFTREQLVANFWILIGLLVVSGVVNGLTDLMFKR
jgi:hypothetical protein